jgi:hypothetical protein
MSSSQKHSQSFDPESKLWPGKHIGRKGIFGEIDLRHILFGLDFFFL